MLEHSSIHLFLEKRLQKVMINLFSYHENTNQQTIEITFDMDQIRTELYKIDMNNPEDILKFYQKHKLCYENLNKAIDKMTIEEFILVKQKYCIALETKNKYSEAIIVLEQVYILLDRLKNKSSRYYSSLYEKTLFWEGIFLGRQEKYTESNEVFKKLILLDPKNEKYEDWYLTNKECLIKNKINVMEYLFSATFFITIVWGDKLFDKNIFIVKLIVFALLISIVTIKQLYRRMIKMPETKKPGK